MWIQTLLLPLPFLLGVSPHVCPVIKTVPYMCIPGAIYPSHCIYGAFFGTYELTDERSSFCPMDEGYIGVPDAQDGCLYTKTGTEETFCFKDMSAPPTDMSAPPPDGITTIQLNLQDAPIAPSPNMTACQETFPNLSEMTTEEQAGLCCGEEFCQNDAGCFLNETSGIFKTYCQCFLQFSLQPDTTISLPATGKCSYMASTDWDCSTSSECYESGAYTVCPYCQVTKDNTTVGEYQTGKGVFDSDMMVFSGSYSGCPDSTTGLFWYCWYDVMDVDVVAISHSYLLVEEVAPCDRYAYIYTPLACSFAASATAPAPKTT